MRHWHTTTGKCVHTITEQDNQVTNPKPKRKREINEEHLLSVILSPAGRMNKQNRKEKREKGKRK